MEGWPFRGLAGTFRQTAKKRSERPNRDNAQLWPGRGVENIGLIPDKHQFFAS
jgi:hypothetical protein